MTSTETSIRFQSECNDLKTIGNIEFTEREIDVTACVLSGRTAQKSIAAFLTTPSQTISPRTVETHLRNIMRKIGCLSQSGIIDFMEQSDKRALIRQHYEYLHTQIRFERKLESLRARLSPKQLYVIYEDSKQDLIQTLLHHFELAGIKTIKNKNKSVAINPQLSEHHLYVVSNELIDQFEADKKNSVLSKQIQQALLEKKDLTFLLFEETVGPIPEEFSKIGIIDIGGPEKYYVLFFELLQRIDPSLDLNQTILEFQKGLADKKFHKNHLQIEEKKPFAFIGADFWKSKKWIIPLITASASFLYLIDWVFESHKMAKLQHPTQISIHSNLLVPLSKNLLQRPRFLQQIEDNLTNGKGIRIVALIGVGGAGKTTLSRQYAMKQKTGFVWEVNAETLTTLTNSFEKMAFDLCQTEEEHRTLRSFKAIQKATERAEKILGFAKNKLKTIPNWLLIYDNAEKLAGIQEYIPTDLHAWGSGRVILTTRDNHIQQNLYIPHAIFIDKLTPQEKIELFRKILSPRGKNPSFNAKETEQFLEKIDSFPLDVSVAAFYLKATGNTYDQYLEELSHYQPDFTMLQERVLKDATHYKATRYSIISLSINKLLKLHKDFGELMIFISLLDSQNIPRNFLDSLKDRVVVDNFIYQLKEYSLITSLIVNSDSSFSLHRSTQTISLQYLKQELGLGKDKKIVQNIARIVRNHMGTLVREEEYKKLKGMAHHFEVFFTHKDLLTDKMKMELGIDLGYFYYILGEQEKSKLLLEKILGELGQAPCPDKENFADASINLAPCYEELGRYKEAKELLERGLSIHRKLLPQKKESIVKSLLYLGILYRDLGDYRKAKDFLMELCTQYDEYCSKNYISLLGWGFGFLGIVFRELGEYEKARHFLEKSIDVFQQSPNQDDQVHFLLGSLALVYSGLGDYKKTKDLLEKSFEFCNKTCRDTENYCCIAQSFLLLGEVCKNLGDYEKARTTLEKSRQMLNIQCEGWCVLLRKTLAQLGDVHRVLGKFEESNKFFKEALSLYEKHYGPEHLETARVFKMLAQLHLEMNDLKTAETYLEKALKIFQKSEHPEIYTIFEVQADLYLKKSVALKENPQQAETFKKEALNSLAQAQEAIKKHLPEGSPHLKRAQMKMKAIY